MNFHFTTLDLLALIALGLIIFAPYILAVIGAVLVLRMRLQRRYDKWAVIILAMGGGMIVRDLLLRLYNHPH